MNYLNILAIFDGSKKYDFGNGAVGAILAILIVFSVLLLIIGITTLIFNIMHKFESKNTNKVENVENNENKNNNVIRIDTNDEDLMAAILVATIDYRQEVKKDVRVVSVREVK